MQAFTITLIVLCSVASAFGEEFSGENRTFATPPPVVVVHPQPSRPVVVVRPQPPRPVVVVHPQPPRPVVVVHPQTHRSDDSQTQALEERAVELVESHNKALKQLQGDSQRLVKSAIESELILVEALINELRTEIANTSKPLDEHHLLLLEEQLIRHEFQLTEQITAAKLAVIEQKKKDEEAKMPVDPKKPAELVEKANDLIKKGSDALVNASLLEISSIQSEIHEIEALIRAIQAKPSVAEFREDELLLEGHERALQILIDRIKK